MKYAGRIYKISSPSTDKVYIGSTKMTLKQRMTSHYRFTGCSSKQLIDYGNAVIELVEDVYTDDDDLNYALKQRERYYILNTPNTVNKKLPYQFRTEKEYLQAYKKLYNEANKDKIKEYRKANKDKLSEKARNYYEANKDKIKEYREARNYYEANKDKIKEYREANKEKYKQYGIELLERLNRKYLSN